MTETLLTHYLIVAAILFSLGMVGFLTRRNMIVLFISAEMMLQGVAINLVTFNQYYRLNGILPSFDGQIFTLMILTVAAAEAAIALALVVVLFGRSGSLDISLWHHLRDPGQPAVELTPSISEPARQPNWPTLPVAGLAPEENGSAEPLKPITDPLLSPEDKENPDA